MRHRRQQPRSGAARRPPPPPQWRTVLGALLRGERHPRRVNVGRVESEILASHQRVDIAKHDSWRCGGAVLAAARRRLARHRRLAAAAASTRARRHSTRPNPWCRAAALARTRARPSRAPSSPSRSRAASRRTADARVVRAPRVARVKRPFAFATATLSSALRLPQPTARSRPAAPGQFAATVASENGSHGVHVGGDSSGGCCCRRRRRGWTSSNRTVSGVPTLPVSAENATQLTLAWHAAQERSKFVPAASARIQSPVKLALTTPSCAMRRRGDPRGPRRPRMVHASHGGLVCAVLRAPRLRRASVAAASSPATTCRGGMAEDLAGGRPVARFASAAVRRRRHCRRAAGRSPPPPAEVETPTTAAKSAEMDDSALEMRLAEEENAAARAGGGAPARPSRSRSPRSAARGCSRGARQSTMLQPVCKSLANTWKIT